MFRIFFNHADIAMGAQQAVAWHSRLVFTFKITIGTNAKTLRPRPCPAMSTKPPATPLFMTTHFIVMLYRR